MQVFLFNFGDYQNYIRNMKKEIERKRVKKAEFTSKCCKKKKKQILSSISFRTEEGNSKKGFFSQYEWYGWLGKQNKSP